MGTEVSEKLSPRVGVIMGSDSDWSVMEAAVEALAEFDIPFEIGVVSAHRTPGRMLDYACPEPDWEDHLDMLRQQKNKK